MSSGEGGGAPLLEVTRLCAGYGRVPILDDVSIAVSTGGFVALVGSNGAGKSTLLRAVTGLADISSGDVRFDSSSITGKRTARIARAGLRHVAEGRRVFRGLSVAENLHLGVYGIQITRAEEKARREDAVDLFPVLERKYHHAAGTLSGGEQQMLTIAQALMSAPKLIMLDEPSLGLAPVIIDQVFDRLVALNHRGVGLLLVEQMVERALEVADYAYVMRLGKIVYEGSAVNVAAGDELRAAYLGDRKST